ncbi:anti-sigma-factor antagonist [Desulfonatronospira thiodismutans ASO3-1]|uniref:Anti-sigma-factor antagonist n=1 Tax=Desulfonatronospira thiodismutans ASO3-1 TaxID=555779 RepID=D6SSS8_9BACT|nr:STAS domain-containing protein [Desulfonatronospira thiodismutans]EFI33744.1 anti-sigma-factor antagonist [Desulfonatronospira thiodismutans ASO3-1]
MNNSMQQNDIQILKLTGDCSVQNATEVLQLFSQALETAQSLALDLSEVEKSDISLMQIICAAHQSFAAREKCIRLSGLPSEPVMETWKSGGFGQVCLFGREECLFKEVGVNG